MATVLTAVAACAATLSLAVVPAAAAGRGFSDVPRSQLFYGDITWLAARGITTGNADGTFGPTQPVTRQAMAAFLYRFANPGKSAPACTSKPFSDVPTSSPFCGDVAWLAAHHVTMGNTDGTYGPVVAVSRQAMAAFMYRIVNNGASAPACLTPPFPDVPTSNPFCGAIGWLVGQGVTDGFGDGGYHPTDAVAREAMAAFLHRLSAPAPTTSAAHYIRTTDRGTVRAAGAADATADQQAGGSHLHLLDIGAQSITAPLSAATPGVVLTTTSIRITYLDLVTLLQAYLDGYQSVSTGRAIVAVGTNSDGCFSTCKPASSNSSASVKGSDWWNQVIAPLRSYAAQSTPGLTVVAADDIEPGFSATAAEAAQWERAYLSAATTAGTSGLQLVFNGSADGCAYRYGQSGGSCNHGWTQAQLAQLAGGPNTQALPQIYNGDQAVQWANIAGTGAAKVTFLGSLTEYGVAAGSSQLPSRGWISLWNALTAAATAPVLPYSADLDVIG